MLAGCLDETRAAAFAAGELTAVAREEIEAHVDDCDTCRRVLSTLVRTSAPSWQPGAQVGRYVLGERIGRGGMAEV
ncbi:MAG TPA: zf-HC2 domain-containing protein, partial [Kofleriaceae bacterium]|nr:zf-HC2 domain-containing protein [Kofleriaceae bacterium]